MTKENLEKMLNEGQEAIKDQESFSTFVHGGLCAGHLLGMFYNFKKKNYIDMSIHGLVAIYDLLSTYKHYKEVNK